MDFCVELIAWQFVRGAFGSEYIETSKIFHHPGEFAEAFHNLLQDLKAGTVESIMSYAGYTGDAWTVENGPGDLFRVREEFTDDSSGPWRTMKEETAFCKCVEYAFHEEPCIDDIMKEIKAARNAA